MYTKGCNILKKISIINIRNSIDEIGKPVGHAVKSMKEAFALIKMKYEVEFISSIHLKNEFHGYSHKCVPFSQKYTAQPKKMVNFFKDYINTVISLIISDANINWFILISEPVFWAIAFLPKGRKKYLATVYMDFSDYFSTINTLKKFRKKIYLKACQKIDLIIATNEHFRTPTTQIYIPDYYLTNKLKAMAKTAKKYQIICVGQMRESRDLDSVVKVFSQLTIPVEIIGQFCDKTWYNNLSKNAGSNIHIEDVNLTDDEYYKKLSESKYSILPYDMKIYHKRTSGVLLETVLLGVVPIAPKELLEYNKIGGIGYSNINEIPKLIKNYDENQIIYNKVDFDPQYLSIKLNTAIKSILTDENNYE